MINYNISRFWNINQKVLRFPFHIWGNPTLRLSINNYSLQHFIFVWNLFENRQFLILFTLNWITILIIIITELFHPGLQRGQRGGRVRADGAGDVKQDHGHILLLPVKRLPGKARTSSSDPRLRMLQYGPPPPQYLPPLDLDLHHLPSSGRGSPSDQNQPLWVPFTTLYKVYLLEYICSLCRVVDTFHIYLSIFRF